MSVKYIFCRSHNLTDEAPYKNTENTQQTYYTCVCVYNVFNMYSRWFGFNLCSTLSIKLTARVLLFLANIPRKFNHIPSGNFMIYETDRKSSACRTWDTSIRLPVAASVRSSLRHPIVNKPSLHLQIAEQPQSTTLALAHADAR